MYSHEESPKSFALLRLSVKFILAFLPILLFSVFVSAQEYKSWWDQADTFINNGQPKSALEVIDKIHKTAAEDGNGPMLIKALIHEVKLNAQFEEESLVESITRMETELQNLQSPTKQIVHSLVAEMYWGYYQNNRWRINERTASETDSKDILTWDFKHIVSKVDQHYKQSLLQVDELKNATLKTYQPILTGDRKYRNLRPSLYHLLIARALTFYSSEESDLLNFDKSGVYADARLLGNKTAFLSWNSSDGDGLQPAIRTIKLYQQLLLGSEKLSVEAQVSEDLSRLEFMQRRSQLSNKDSLFENTLNELLTTHSGKSVSAEITHHLAKFYMEQGNAATASDQPFYWNFKKADELCQQAIKDFPNSFGARNCQSVSEQIRQKEWRIEAEGNIMPNDRFRFLLRYRNHGNSEAENWPVYTRIASIDPKKFRAESRQHYGAKLVKWLKQNSETVNETTFQVPNPGDFRSHSIELPMDRLPVGTYVLFVGTDKALSTKNEAVAHAIITVTDMAVITRQNNEGNTTIKVVSRKLGTPLVNAKIELLILEYNRRNRSNNYQLSKTLTTNSNGEATWTGSSQNYRGMMMDVYFENDQLIGADNLYGYSNNEKIQWSNQTQFFLDRAIYRPGQTIHFKGLMLRTDGMNVETETNKNTTVKLYDGNGQEVSSLNLKTNGYGTFSGTFIAPTGGLNGFIRIGNESGSHAFRMEEYKRPKFEVSVDPPSNQFRINDTVTVAGTAMSYSGVPLSGAEIKYRVTRTARFPFRWLCWGWFPQSNPKQVAFGTATTDALGTYSISFKAESDPLVQPKYLPVFQYNIEVDLTDASGEMQTGNSTVSVGYHALNLSMELPETIERKDLKKYKVNVTNLSGEPQDAKVTVKVWTLKPTERILRNRRWANPDQYYLTEKEHENMFWYESYKNEQDFRTWDKKSNMLDTKFNSGSVDEVSLEPLNGLKAGHYLVEMSAKDAFGKEVTQRQYFTLIGEDDTEPAFATTAWFYSLKDEYQPDEKLEILVATSYKSVAFLVEVEVKEKGVRTNRLIHSEKLTLSEAQQKLTIPVTEAWRGNAQVHITAVRNNEMLSWSKTISVPYSNKKLNVSLETFRKEMTPDSEEKWTIKITDNDRKPVKAELLCTMYDASLDVLAANNWGLFPYNSLNAKLQWQSSSFQSARSQVWNRDWQHYPSSARLRNFESVNWFGYYFSGGIGRIQGARAEVMASMERDDEMEDIDVLPGVVFKGKVPAKYGDTSGGIMNQSEGEDKEQNNQPPKIKLRSDFSETVFFHPHLNTDENGKVEIDFNAPQSLTRWKFMALATTKNLKIGTTTQEVVTRKQLMITPNYPRFVREGDKLVFQVKVNVLDSTLRQATVSLEIKNGLTDEKIELANNELRLTIADGAAIAHWEIDIPEGISALKFTTKAWSENHSDGEEKTIAVLPNRMLVTESMPMPVRGKGKHSFTFDKLKNNTSSSLRNHSLTLEFTPNPIWLAVLSLPYMMEYPYECSEQIFSRYYANAIATHLANSDPKIKAVFEQWKRDAVFGTDLPRNAQSSPLDHNPELKQILLNETPWIRDAQNETEQRRRIAELFDLERMQSELETALKKLGQNQKPDGGWGWFNGMRSNFYITRHIVSGFGKLRRMGVFKADEKTMSMLKKAIAFMDDEMVKSYERRRLRDKKYVPSWSDLHLIHARSFWLEDVPLTGKAKTTYKEILDRMEEHWTTFDAPQKGLAAVGLFRASREKTAKQILVSLRETALTSEEFGTYWNMDKGYYWYHAPIENHVMIMEAFNEVENDMNMISEMKIWLLKQKQTQSWETTKATADACYALLGMDNEASLTTKPTVSINMGNETIDPRTNPDTKTEAGTGYFKTNWTGSSINPEMGKITVTKDNDGVAWGAVYWQYFEDLDKITGATDNPIKMQREVMLLHDTKDGPLLKKLDGNTSLSVGDRIKVRIVLKTDRHMEFVHLKDMRAASFEPRKQLSGARSQEGLYYYQSPTDAAMNFFFDYMPKGTFVFEYDLNVTQAGTFSNGISQLQCIYAPEFTTHSKGVRLEVKQD